MWSDPPYAIATLVLAGLTVGVLRLRFQWKLESNWPLVYYAGLLVYRERYPGILEPNCVYAAVVSGLLLRFEFVAPWLARVLLAIEGLALLYVLWALIRVMVS